MKNISMFLEHLSILKKKYVGNFEIEKKLTQKLDNQN